MFFVGENYSLSFIHSIRPTCGKTRFLDQAIAAIQPVFVGLHNCLGFSEQAPGLKQPLRKSMPLRTTATLQLAQLVPKNGKQGHITGSKGFINRLYKINHKLPFPK